MRFFLPDHIKILLYPIISCLLYSYVATATADDEGSIGTINVAYANILGSGIYSIDNRTAFVLNMPFEFGLYEPENADWSMDLLLPLTIGVLDASDSDFLDFLDRDKLQTLGITPGIKMYIPYHDHWIIKPFVQAGYIFDLQDNHDAWVYMGGVTGIGRYQFGDYNVGFGGGLTALEQQPVNVGDKSGIGVAELGLDVRRTLNMQFQNQPVEMSVYTIASRYYNSLELLEIDDENFQLKYAYTIGVTIGTAAPFRVLGINLQRVGMGYKFGNGLKSITFNLGFPF